MRITKNEAKSLGVPVQAKRSKYGNTKTKVDGILFDSAKEAKRYGELKLLEKEKKIRHLGLQPMFPMIVNKVSVCKYVADFIYMTIDSKGFGTWVVEDVKGMKTAVYRLKKKLMKACHGIDVREV